MLEQDKKSHRQSSRRPNKIDPAFLAVYDRTTCVKCEKPITKRRIENCKKRRFWPVCPDCEKIIIPIYKEAIKKMAEIQKGFG